MLLTTTKRTQVNDSYEYPAVLVSVPTNSESTQLCNGWIAPHVREESHKLSGLPLPCYASLLTPLLGLQSRLGDNLVGLLTDMCFCKVRHYE